MRFPATEYFKTAGLGTTIGTLGGGLAGAGLGYWGGSALQDLAADELPGAIDRASSQADLMGAEAKATGAAAEGLHRLHGAAERIVPESILSEVPVQDAAEALRSRATGLEVGAGMNRAAAGGMGALQELAPAAPYVGAGIGGLVGGSIGHNVMADGDER